jgi:hypothetical protein
MYNSMIGKKIWHQSRQVIIRKIVRSCCGKTRFLVEDSKTGKQEMIIGRLPGQR